MKSNRNYIATNQFRLVRPLVERALYNFDFTKADCAVDFGCGLGVETAYLATTKTWKVLAIDQDPELLGMAAERLQSIPNHSVEFRQVSFQDVYELPSWDFFCAYHSLHFTNKEQFDRLWKLITSTAKANARIAISLFGEKDSMVKHGRAQGCSEDEIILKLSGFSIDYFKTTYEPAQEAVHYHEVIASKYLA